MTAIDIKKTTLKLDLMPNIIKNEERLNVWSKKILSSLKKTFMCAPKHINVEFEHNESLR